MRHGLGRSEWPCGDGIAHGTITFDFEAMPKAKLSFLKSRCRLVFNAVGGKSMKLFVTLGLLTLLVSSAAFAKDTPFDSFAGRYLVKSHKCYDLRTNKQMTVDPYKNVAIVPTEINKQVRILKSANNAQSNLIYSEDLGIYSGRFSGDGLNSAKWSQRIEETDFSFLNEISLYETANQFVLTEEYKHFDQRPGLSINNHYRCEMVVAVQ